MTRLPPHDWEELSAGYALGNLSPEEAEALQRLLETQPELALELEQFSKTLSLLAQTQLHPAPSHLRSHVLAAVSESDAKPRLQTSEAETDRRASAIAPQTPWLVVSSLAAVVIALGADSYRLKQELNATQQALREIQQQLRSQAVTTRQNSPSVFLLSGTEAAQNALASVIISSEREIIVSAKNLPSLPEGQAYCLWAFFPHSSEPVLYGQFAANSQGELSASLTIPAAASHAEVSRLAISEELANAPSYPQGTIVMQSVYSNRSS